MQTISGLVKTTPIKWVPVLSNIALSRFQREHNLICEWHKYTSNLNLPIHKDLPKSEEVL